MANFAFVASRFSLCFMFSGSKIVRASVSSPYLARRALNDITPRTPTPFKNALAAVVRQGESNNVSIRRWLTLIVMLILM